MSTENEYNAFDQLKSKISTVKKNWGKYTVVELDNGDVLLFEPLKECDYMHCVDKLRNMEWDQYIREDENGHVHIANSGNMLERFSKYERNKRVCSNCKSEVPPYADEALVYCCWFCGKEFDHTKDKPRPIVETQDLIVY